MAVSPAMWRTSHCETSSGIRRRLQLACAVLGAACWYYVTSPVLFVWIDPMRQSTSRCSARRQAWLPRSPVANERKACISRASSASTPSTDEEENELPRRVALVGAFGIALLASKKYLTDGNMEELVLPANSLKGRTIVITGGNTGLGLESAERLASAGATIVVTARSDEKGNKAVEEIRRLSGNNDVHYLKLDLADLDSVKGFKSKFEAQPYGDHIDVLMNNAGVMAIPTRMETKDGFEQQIGTNHLGHFALVATLLPALKKAAGGARVINVSSTAHLGATKKDLEGDFMSPSRYTQWGAYCASKLANVLFAKELDRRVKAAGLNITAVSCHPGAISTDLQRWLIADGDAQAARARVAENPAVQSIQSFLTRPLNLGANTQVYLAAGADGGYDKSGGRYFDNMAPGLENPDANNETLARDLWSESERLTSVSFDI